jgi:uncharacterized membrane protein
VRANARENTAEHHGWTDDRLDVLIGNLLRAGVTLSAVLVFIGGLLYLIKYGQNAPAYQSFRGEPSNLRHVSGIVTSAFSGAPRGLIQLGLLVLIATPVARVAFSVFAFAIERDWLYVVVTVIVLGLLLYSLAGS